MILYGLSEGIMESVVFLNTRSCHPRGIVLYNLRGKEIAANYRE